MITKKTESIEEIIEDQIDENISSFIVNDCQYHVYIAHIENKDVSKESIEGKCLNCAEEDQHLVKSSLLSSKKRSCITASIKKMSLPISPKFVNQSPKMACQDSVTPKRNSLEVTSQKPKTSIFC